MCRGRRKLHFRAQSPRLARFSSTFSGQQNSPMLRSRRMICYRLSRGVEAPPPTEKRNESHFQGFPLVGKLSTQSTDEGSPHQKPLLFPRRRQSDGEGHNNNIIGFKGREPFAGSRDGVPCRRRHTLPLQIPKAGAPTEAKLSWGGIGAFGRRRRKARRQSSQAAYFSST